MHNEQCQFVDADDWSVRFLLIPYIQGVSKVMPDSWYALVQCFGITFETPCYIIRVSPSHSGHAENTFAIRLDYKRITFRRSSVPLSQGVTILYPSSSIVRS